MGVRNGSATNGGLNMQPVRPPPGSATSPSTRSTSVSVTPSTGVGRLTVPISLPGPLGAGLRPESLDFVSADRLQPGFALDIPALRLVLPSIIPPVRQYPVDTLNVAQTKIRNGQFEPILDEGIAAFRPEIISITDFSPIWRPGAVFTSGKFITRQNTDAGDFINLQYQTSQLRQETLLKLVDSLQRSNRRTTSDDTFNKVRQDYQAELRLIETNISYFRDILQNIENLKNALEIKKIQKSFFNNTYFLPIPEFFEKRMQYTRGQFNTFSDTKILLQMLFDFRSVLEGYSLSLIDLKDPDRENDYSPVKIDKTYTTTNGFSFTIANLRSVAAPVNATNNNFFNQFINSLPQNPDDRIKILTMLLSKEYLVSRGLGSQNIQRLLKEFGAGAEGNPFDNVIGEVGDTIFEAPQGLNSLASLMYIDPGIPNAKVLPFESKYVDSDDQKFVYVPGSAYFIDSILAVNGNNWDTAPYVNYVNLYNDRLKVARTLIENIMNFSNTAEELTPQSVNDSLLNSTRASISGLVDDRTLDNDQAIITAIFKLAATDNILKSMLFQYSILVGMAANSTTEQKEIFDLLATTELANLGGLSYLQVPTGRVVTPTRGLAVLRPFIDQLAKAIETRVSSLTTKINVDFARILTNRDLFSTVRPRLASTRVTSTLSSGFNARLAGTSGINSLINKGAGMVNIQIQRGSITRILTSLVTKRSLNTSNFIREFVDLATRFFKAGQVQGSNVHVLQDGTNRTRFNFLSLSTQLLLLFEILCSYAAKYSFSSFERSNNLMVSTISIDTTGHKVVKATIEQATKAPITLNNAASLITTMIKSTAGQSAEAIGSTRPVVEVVTPGGAKVSPARGRASVKTFSPSYSSKSSGRASFSNAVFSQASNELSSVLQNSSTFIDTLTGSTQNASELRNFAASLFSGETLNRFLLDNNKFMSIRSTILGNRRKIVEEVITISNFLHILVVIGQYMQNASARIQSSFNQQTLQNFLATNNARGLNLLRNPSQVRTAAYVFQNIKDKTPARTRNQDTGYVNNNLVISDVVTDAEYKCLVALLSEAQFRSEFNAEKRTKILSVGIPSGFSKELADRVNISEIDKNTFGDKESDVITVNVYKRDARFDDIVFKPQRFMFDLSLFPLEKDLNQINPTEGEAFDRLLLRAQITDFQALTSTKKQSIASISADSKYNFLQPDDRKRLIRNHLVSYLLGMYTNFMTGIRISEDVFLQGSSVKTRDLTSLMQTLVFSYLRDVRRVTIPPNARVETLLEDPSLSEDTKDVLRLTTYGSMVFNQGEATNRVLTPKLFDRVFFVPLDIENFEVDLELTLSTESGRLAWNQSYVQNKLVRVGNKTFFRPKNKNDLVFEDYFVAIETATDRE